MPRIVKGRPIIFSAPMIRAILSGRKTQTRRVVKPQPVNKLWHTKIEPDDWAFGYRGHPHRTTISNKPHGPDGYVSECPYGKAGDRLWVRETWQVVYDIGDGKNFSVLKPSNEKTQEATRKALYKASHTVPSNFGGTWKPSIHMPRWASRITLELTALRVERVRSISEMDAFAEGSPCIDNPDFDQSDPCDDRPQTHVAGFMDLWDKINGTRPGCSWDDNPWVWVIEFRRVESQVHGGATHAAGS